MGDQEAAPSFTCPVCGMTSFNENDIREGYCGNCHDWTRANGADRYEEHRRRVDEILAHVELTARRNLWRRFIWSTVAGTAGFTLVAGLLDSAVHHVPWNWEEAGIRAGLYAAFSCAYWACLMWWNRHTNPLWRKPVKPE